MPTAPGRTCASFAIPDFWHKSDWSLHYICYKYVVAFHWLSQLVHKLVPSFAASESSTTPCGDCCPEAMVMFPLVADRLMWQSLDCTAKIGLLLPNLKSYITVMYDWWWFLEQVDSLVRFLGTIESWSLWLRLGSKGNLIPPPFSLVDHLKPWPILFFQLADDQLVGKVKLPDGRTSSQRCHPEAASVEGPVWRWALWAMRSRWWNHRH